MLRLVVVESLTERALYNCDAICVPFGWTALDAGCHKYACPECGMELKQSPINAKMRERQDAWVQESHRFLAGI